MCLKEDYRTHKFFILYLIIINLNKLVQLFYHLSSSTKGWLLMQVFLTSGQLLLCYEQLSANRHKKQILIVSLLNSLGFVCCLWWFGSQTTSFQLYILIKSYLLLTMCMFFFTLVFFSSPCLLNTGLFIYFAILYVASTFGNNGLGWSFFRLKQSLYTYQYLDTLFNMLILLPTALWLAHFRMESWKKKKIKRKELILSMDQ